MVIASSVPCLIIVYRSIRRNDKSTTDPILVPLLRIVSIFTRAGGHKNAFHFFVSSTLVPVFLLLWANLYFGNSSFVSTGVILIYVVPLITACCGLPHELSVSLPIPRGLLTSSMCSDKCVNPPAASGDPNWLVQNSNTASSWWSSFPGVRLSLSGSGSAVGDRDRPGVHLRVQFNTAVVCLLSVVAGHISFLAALDVLHPNVIPLAAPILGLYSVDLNKEYGLYCLAFISSSAFYIFGFLYILFEKDGMLPSQSVFGSKLSTIGFILISIVRFPRPS